MRSPVPASRVQRGCQGLAVFAFVGVVFFSGIFVGVKFFHAHEVHGSDGRPWLAFTQNRWPAWSGNHTDAPAAGVQQPALREDHTELAFPDADALGGAPSQGAPAKAANSGAPKPLHHVEDPSDAPPAEAADPAPEVAQPARQAPQPVAAPGSAWPRVGSTAGVPSARFRGSNYVDVDSPLDWESITVAAWVFLSSQDQTANMKTIVANRWAGCAINPSRHGFAFYVNDWGTANRQLRVVMGNDKSGCEALASPAEAIPYDQWTHVAMVLQPESLTLYVNGVQVARGEHRHMVQPVENFRVGLHTDGEAGFIGNISHVAVWHRALTGVEVDAAVLAPPAPDDAGLQLHLPLQDITDRSRSTRDASPLGHATVVAPMAAGAQPASLPSPLLPTEAVAPPAPSAPPVLPASPPSAAGAVHSALRGAVPAPNSGSEVASEAALMQVPLAELVEGTFSTEVPLDVRRRSDERGRVWREEVKRAMQHAWTGYKTHAWGRDEVKPQSGTGQDNWAGLAVTMIDSLDTLYLMGMHEEFKEARDYLKAHLNFDRGASVSVFETTIRVLGGLLSAYDLSKDKVFLDKAVGIADRLLPAFDTPSGLPRASVVLNSGASSNPSWTSGSILSELGTLQLEFRYLSRHTGNPVYEQKAMRVFAALKDKATADGLFPIFVDPNSVRFTSSKVTFGALGDSFYEYLLKAWLQGGKQEPALRTMYQRSMDGLHSRLLQRSTPSGLLYIADLEGNHLVHKMDHLACFTSAMLALGAHHMPASPTSQRDMQSAKALAYTCVQLYTRQPTGLSPEYVRFVANQDMVVPSQAPFYILRPEVVESLFVLHQLTHHPIFREWGWAIFKAIEKHCRTSIAYGAYPDVRMPGRTPDNRMESFYLAETLKYLYLLMDPDHAVDLDKQVFNTEAHPLTVFDQDGLPANQPISALQ